MVSQTPGGGVIGGASCGRSTLRTSHVTQTKRGVARACRGAGTAIPGSGMRVRDTPLAQGPLARRWSYGSSSSTRASVEVTGDGPGGCAGADHLAQPRLLRSLTGMSDAGLGVGLLICNVGVRGQGLATQVAGQRTRGREGRQGPPPGQGFLPRAPPPAPLRPRLPGLPPGLTPPAPAADSGG